MLFNAWMRQLMPVFNGSAGFPAVHTTSCNTLPLYQLIWNKYIIPNILNKNCYGILSMHWYVFPTSGRKHRQRVIFENSELEWVCHGTFGCHFGCNSNEGIWHNFRIDQTAEALLQTVITDFICESYALCTYQVPLPTTVQLPSQIARFVVRPRGRTADRITRRGSSFKQDGEEGVLGGPRSLRCRHRRLQELQLPRLLLRPRDQITHPPTSFLPSQSHHWHRQGPHSKWTRSTQSYMCTCVHEYMHMNII